jgi:hypothetical protein
VQQIIGFAVGLGRIICITDEAAAAARDAQMLAARQDPRLGPPPPPPPRLGPGLLRRSDPQAGSLGLQGRVRKAGLEGRFDDVVGRGFVLISVQSDPLVNLSAAHRAFWQKIKGLAVHVGGPLLTDVDGSYAAWLESMRAAVVLLRPDHHVFGVSEATADADSLVGELQQALEAAHV